MPIVVEEEKSKRARFITLVSVFAIVGLILFILYSVFLKTQPVTKYAANGSFKHVQDLSKITVSPSVITNDPTFKVLTEYVPLVIASTTGRDNPFVAYDGYIILTPGRAVSVTSTLSTKP